MNIVSVVENSDPSAFDRYTAFDEDGNYVGVTEHYQFIRYGSRGEPRLTPLSRREVNMLEYHVRRNQRVATRSSSIGIEHRYLDLSDQA